MAKRSLLGNIKIIYTDDPLTTSSGLGPMVEAFHKSPMSKGFYSSLPSRNSVRSLGKRRLGLIFLSSLLYGCLLYTSPSPRDATLSRMPSSA